MSKITPALTSEEWKQLDTDECAIWDGVFHVHCEQSVPAKNPHAIAALALHEQPFGFTRADVAMCDALAQNWTIDFDEMQTLMASLRDRIAALLPPES